MRWSFLILILSVTPALADDDLAKAKEHYRRGTKLYDLQKFSESAQEYEQAYELKDDPTLLFNIGQAYRFAGDSQKALGAYRSYLRRVPNAPNRAAVQGLMEDLQRVIAAQRATSEKPPTETIRPETPLPPHPAETTPPPPTPPQALTPPPKKDERQAGKRIEYTGVGIGVVGLALTITGAAFAGLTSSLNHDFNHPAQDAVYDSSLESKGRTYQTLEAVFLAVGGAAVVTGVALIVVGHQRAHRTSVALGPGSLQLRGTF
jgi:tetratricopeptide (TPR) repeat protein